MGAQRLEQPAGILDRGAVARADRLDQAVKHAAQQLDLTGFARNRYLRAAHEQLGRTRIAQRAKNRIVCPQHASGVDTVRNGKANPSRTQAVLQ